MRKSLIITVKEVGEVTVKEVSPFALYRALNATDKAGEMISLISDCVSLPDGKQLQDLWPSEIEQIVDAFVEVNSAFLGIADKLGLRGMLVGLSAIVTQNLPKLFAESYRQVMESMPGTTAGAAS
ncbi:hypothetical protein [Desulfofustis limnaeus]|uniref:Uncharacterized protein n=1 Tax=Desulfofustis limnaeus TaxID=2740163 RepID=A0ABM7W4W8_9BACT|nr:hypothetical protein [Desulfofustis limnaeus]BDD85926.1 hypothetical protein DPPLL_02910 [Desulfofustis limnaeus]